ncbi:hypothetical protein MESS2_1480092 [Mesorhizobium metallidurans STM 2683]|uniref:Uncharacterized protein n=1 Tax=Mesorhizobium metallidurans STM 2683 TaxID=1297569 RepID=M5EZS1_9HYPH|nr:hypothetical protein MESS2_1480092 [Mesorhizobium metallidurans STM 2683]
MMVRSLNLGHNVAVLFTLCDVKMAKRLNDNCKRTGTIAK